MKNVVNQTVLVPTDIQCMDKNKTNMQDISPNIAHILIIDCTEEM